MLKYADIPNYKGLGEVGGMMSHLYQWIETDADTPNIILVHAYEGEPSVFKGLVFMASDPKTYLSVPLLDDERKALESILGDVRFIEDINEFNKIVQVFPEGEHAIPHNLAD